MKTVFCLIASLLLLRSVASAHEPKPDISKSTGLTVLVYSNTGYYRHPDIPKINRWLVLLGHDNGIDVDVTEHWKDLRPAELSRYDVLILNNANELDLVLPLEQRQAVEQWFAKGNKGIVGLHAVLVHQQKWPWLNQLGGCDFNSDSDFSKAKITVDPAAKDHPVVKGQPAEFWCEADWTNHDRPVTGLPGFRVSCAWTRALTSRCATGSRPATANPWARIIPSPGPMNRRRGDASSIPNSDTTCDR